MIGSIFSVHSAYESRATVVVFSGLTAVSILVMRRLSWIGIRWLRSRGYNQSLAVCVGTGRVARKTAHALRRASWMGIKVLGYVEDQNIVIDVRYPAGRELELAVELARDQVDIIVAGGDPDILAARQATSSIPVVMIVSLVVGDEITSLPAGSKVACDVAPDGSVTAMRSPLE